MLIVGVDEVGRGCLAGPVVTAAVAFPHGIQASLAGLLGDSKQLSPAARRRADTAIRAGGALFAFGAASSAEVDAINVLAATMLAMGRAVRRLGLPAGTATVLVDGNRVPPGLPHPSSAIVGGDGLVPEIMAASILAKVLRDGCVTRLALRHPCYGWERNAGYGTPAHYAALLASGPCAHHRTTFLRKLGPALR